MSSPKTILLYTDESTAGGVAHYNHGLLPALLAAGWRAVSAQPANDSPMLVTQRELGVTQRFLSYAPTHSFVRSFTDTTDPERIMAEIKPDLVYFSDCCPLSNIAAKHVAITRNIPFVVISHSAADYLAQRFPACLPIVKQQLEKARDVIAISQKNLDVLHTHFALAQDKGKVVLNGRPASFFNPADPLVRRRIRAELKIPEDGVLCFTSARFDAAKGFQHQLAGIRLLQAQNALGKLYFAWAGTGDLQAEVANKITAAGLDTRIRLLGQRWDITALLDASDIFILTTMLEGGLPLSVMEAMAKGVPTVVTNVSGIAGVAEGASHMLPDPNSSPEKTATALAEALTALTRNPTRRAELGRAGRALAERNFRQETNLTKTLAILEEALPQHSLPPTAKSEVSTPQNLTPTTPPSGSEMKTVKEAFLLKPDFSNDEWRKIILAYLHTFSPSEPVGLLVHCDSFQIEPAIHAERLGAILDLVRGSGANAFPDIVLVETAGELLDTLRQYSLIHRLPCLGESSATTPASQRFTTHLAKQSLPNREILPKTETKKLAAPVPPPAQSRRQLTIIDYSVQPYSIGDFLIFLMGSLVAAEAADVDKIDFCLLSDPSKPPLDPIMRSRVNAENHYSHLMSFLPLVELNPRLGSLFIFDSATKLGAFLASAGDNYHLWPSQAEIQEQKYMYYDVFKMLHGYHQQHSGLPAFRYNADLTHWSESFIQRHAPASVPVTVNFRSNPHFHSTRNYQPNAWRTFFERCEGKVPVKFIIICAASEVDESLRDLTNVVIAKDHHTTILQDLALIHFAAFHLGSSSGPATLPIFETRPYHNFNSEALPHVHLYGGSLFHNAEGNLQFSFARELQALGNVAETADGIWHQFEKIWTAQNWSGDWLLETKEAKVAPAVALA